MRNESFDGIYGADEQYAADDADGKRHQADDERAKPGYSYETVFTEKPTVRSVFEGQSGKVSTADRTGLWHRLEHGTGIFEIIIYFSDEIDFPFLEWILLPQMSFHLASFFAV